MTASTLLTPELRVALRAEFPYLTDSDLDTATLLGQGWSYTAMRVANLVVRVPRQDAPEAPPVAREAALLAALEARGVPFTPRDARVLNDSSGTVLGNVYRIVDGVSSRGVQLRSPARERFARDIATFLGGLHAFPVADAIALGVPALDLWRDHYAKLIEASHPHLGPRTQAWLDAIVAKFLAEGGTSRAPRALIHSDIAGVHLLLGSDETLAGVIDLADAWIADPALDFAGVLNDWSPAFLERVLAYYPLEVDPDARRRAAFYIAVVPLFSVRYGIEHHDPEELAAGRRKLAARARTSVVRPAAGR